MSFSPFSTILRDPRFTACAVSPEPAWLWNTDATQVIWANAAGAALLDAATVSELTQLRFASDDRTASEVARLAATLSPGGAPRPERLRGFGTSFLRPLTATCSRVTLNDATPAILILGAEPIGHALSLAERARRQFEGCEEAVAVFAPDGAFVYATPNGRQRTAGATTMIAFNASALAAQALSAGASTGDTLSGKVSMMRIGEGNNTLLVLQFDAPLAETFITVPVVPAAPLEIIKSAEPPAQGHAPAPVETAQPALPVETPAPVETSAPAAIVSEPAVPKTPEPAAPLAPEPAQVIDRQHPLRFVWQMDAEEIFTLASDDFINLIGPTTAQVLGKSWNDIAATLQIDPDGQVARAVATRDTWSGINVQWPVDDSAQRLKIELSGLPIYDRQRVFTGYRGFGVCRDLEAFAAIAQDRKNQDRANKVEQPPAAVPEVSAPEAPASEAPVSEQPVTEKPAAETPAPHAAESERPILTVIPPVQNVVPFRAVTPAAPPAPAAEDKSSSLNAGERSAFSEIARQLSVRLKTGTPPTRDADHDATLVLRTVPGGGIDGRAQANAEAPEPETEDAPPSAPAWLTQGSDAHALVDKLPLGVLIYRFETLFYANRSFLEQVGYDTLPAFVEAGGLDSLFIEAEGGSPNSGSQTLTITTGNGDKVPVEGRLFSIPWNGESALALVLVGAAPPREAAPAPVAPQPAAPQSQAPLHDEDDLARIAELEAAITEAQRIADAAAAERAALLGKITEQVRTPMTHAIGTVDTMLEERFGPIGNERYRAYLTDIRGSGMRILSLFEDLASLSKVETVKAGPALPDTNLNDIVKSSVAIMQPEASRVRVLIRTSLSSIALPIKAEAESLSHIVTNLLTNSIRFAGPGGQVIVSTAPAGLGKVSLRLRDTGAGLDEAQLAAFQLAANPDAQTAPADMADEKLTMAITRAMLDANKATLTCTSRPDEGTLVEVTFPTSAL